MGTVTAVKAVPYSLGTDFSDARAIRDLAMYADAAFVAYDTAFTAGPRPPAFLARSTASTSAFGNGNGSALAGTTVEWNTSNGTISGTSGTFTQDVNEVPSWWMFGMNLFVSTATGTATTGAPMEGIFIVTSLDPVTLLAATTGLGDGYPFQHNAGNFTTESTETNTVGESFTATCIVPMYRGSVFPSFGNRDSGVQTKQTIAGSTFWGVRMGAI